MELIKTESAKIGKTDITIEWYVTQDDQPIKGNISASGDDAQDKEMEDWAIAQLESGNVWAWCGVVCEAFIPEYHDLRGCDSLWGCSYESESAFFENGGYADDMRDMAIADLREQIKAAIATGKLLESLELE